MKKYWSLKALVNIIMTIAICIIFTVQMIYLTYLTNLIRIQKDKDVNNAIYQVVNYVGNKLNTMEQVQKSDIYMANLVDFMSAESSETKKQYKEKIVNAIYNIQDFSTDIVYVAGFDYDGHYYNFSNNISEEEYIKISDIYKNYFQKISYNESNYFEFFTLDNNPYKEVYVCSFVPVTLRNYSDVGSRRVGTAVVFVKINTLKMSLELESVNNVSIELSSNSNENRVSFLESQTTKNSEDKSITKKMFMHNTGWSISGTLYSGEMVSLLKYIRWLIVLETIVILFLIILMQIIFSKYVTNPIRKLTKYMDDYAINRRHSPISITNKSEISVISNHFNAMLEKNENMARDIVNTQQKLYETELLEKEAVLYALQSQVNPHFLYNTLECVRTIALVREVPEIVEIMTSMSLIFRYTISNDLYATVQDELLIVEKYISILQIRFPDRFDIIIDISEEILQKRVMKMLLQPIIENAFKHGLASKKNRGILRIRGLVENNMLKFYVFDNGKGIEKEKYNLLLKTICSDDDSWYNGKGVGLTNINNRIKLNYGSEYGLEIDCKEGEYTEVIIKLPK